MWPGLPRSSGTVFGSINALMVAALSKADIPVVAPLSTSTETVKAVPSRAVLSWVMSGILSSSRRCPSIGIQISPRACVAMKLTCWAVTHSAAMARSPSFSRSSSSQMMTIFPALMSAIASSTEARGISIPPDASQSSSAVSTGNRGPVARRSTYLAIISTSKLTASPGPRDPNTVFSHVYGTIVTEKVR